MLGIAYAQRAPFFYSKCFLNASYLFKGPFIMCIFSISVDKGIQSLRDNGAVVGRRIKVRLG